MNYWVIFFFSLSLMFVVDNDWRQQNCNFSLSEKTTKKEAKLIFSLRVFFLCVFNSSWAMILSIRQRRADEQRHVKWLRLKTFNSTQNFVSLFSTISRSLTAAAALFLYGVSSSRSCRYPSLNQISLGCSTTEKNWTFISWCGISSSGCGFFFANFREISHAYRNGIHPRQQHPEHDLRESGY